VIPGADADRPGRFPLRRFRRRPARLVRSADRRRPPLRFCARGGRGSVSTVWRTFRGSLRGCDSSKCNPRCCAPSLTGTPFVSRNRCGFARGERTLAVTRPHQSAPARAFPDRVGHSSRPFLARDVPDLPRSSAAWPGGRVSSLLPPGGAPGVAPFAGLLPIGGWTHGVNPAAKSDDRTARRLRVSLF